MNFIANILRSLTLMGLLVSTVHGQLTPFESKKSEIAPPNEPKKLKEPMVTPKIESSKEINKHTVGLGLGQTFLFSDFDKYGTDKITLDLFYSYSASYSFDFLVNFHYSKHTKSNLYSRLMGLSLNIKSKLFDFDSFSPYILGGLGFYSPELKRSINQKIITSESKVVMGINGGIGADLYLNENFNFGLLADLNIPFKVKQEEQPSFHGYYFKLMMTMGYSF